MRRARAPLRDLADTAEVVVLQVVRIEPCTLDFLEQRDRERAEIIWQRRHGAPHRTRPLLVIDHGPVAGVRR